MGMPGSAQYPTIEKMGARIRRLRKGLGLTQEELGVKVGVKELAVGDWERGKYAPRGENFVALADALGVPPHYLLYGEAGVYREAIEEIAAIVDRALATPAPGAVTDEIQRTVLSPSDAGGAKKEEA